MFGGGPCLGIYPTQFWLSPAPHWGARGRSSSGRPTAGAPGTSISPTSIGRWAEFSRIQRMMTAARSKSGSRTMKFAQDLAFRYICICEPRYGGIRHPFGMRILPQVSCDDMCGFVWSFVDVQCANIAMQGAHGIASVERPPRDHLVWPGLSTTH